MTYTKKLTFEDYLALENSGYEGCVELIDGELVELPPESGINLGIAACVYLKLIRKRIASEITFANVPNMLKLASLNM